MLSYGPFCFKFRCHGNWGRSGKNAIGSIQWPIPENPPIDAKILQIFLYKLSYSQFCLKFCCHGNQERYGVKLNDTIRLAILENHT